MRVNINEKSTVERDRNSRALLPDDQDVLCFMLIKQLTNSKPLHVHVYIEP